MFYRYFNSRLGLEILETDKDFVLYKVRGKDLLIYEFYSENDVKGSMHTLIESIVDLAKKRGCNRMEGYLDKEGKFLERAKYLMEKYGMKPYKESEEYIYYEKKI